MLGSHSPGGSTVTWSRNSSIPDSRSFLSLALYATSWKICNRIRASGKTMDNVGVKIHFGPGRGPTDRPSPAAPAQKVDSLYQLFIFHRSATVNRPKKFKLSFATKSSLSNLNMDPLNPECDQAPTPTTPSASLSPYLVCHQCGDGAPDFMVLWAFSIWAQQQEEEPGQGRRPKVR